MLAVVAIANLNLNNTQAQDLAPEVSKARLGVGLSLGAPTKDNGDFVIAPDLRLQYDLQGRKSLTFTTGYYGFLGKPEIAGQKIGSDIIPLKAGMKFFFGSTFYAQPEIGLGFSTKSGYGTPFIWTPNIGYVFQKWDLSLRYEGFEYNGGSNGMVALRAAYSFNMSK